MLGFFKKRWPGAAQTPSCAHCSTTPKKNRHASAMQRELVRGVFNSVTRMHALPPNALGLVVFPVQQANGFCELHIQIIVMQWGEKLQRHAPHLQQQIHAGIVRDAHFPDISAYIVSWHFSPDSYQAPPSLQPIAACADAWPALPPADEPSFVPTVISPLR